MNVFLIPFIAILFLIFLLPGSLTASHINLKSVILHRVGDVRSDDSGVGMAGEYLDKGGINNSNYSGLVSSEIASEVFLRELRPLGKAFIMERGEFSLEVLVLPMVAVVDRRGHWQPVSGTWEFKDEETKRYQVAIPVQMGGDLDIAYQSTELKMGHEVQVLHYGLTGNPHALSLAKRRLRTAFPIQESLQKAKPVLSYVSPANIIIVVMELTAKGLKFQPIFDYHILQH